MTETTEATGDAMEMQAMALPQMTREQADLTRRLHDVMVASEEAIGDIDDACESDDPMTALRAIIANGYDDDFGLDSEAGALIAAIRAAHVARCRDAARMLGFPWDEPVTMVHDDEGDDGHADLEPAAVAVNA